MKDNTLDFRAIGGASVNQGTDTETAFLNAYNNVAHSMNTDDPNVYMIPTPQSEYLTKEGAVIPENVLEQRFQAKRDAPDKEE